MWIIDSEGMNESTEFKHILGLCPSNERRRWLGANLESALQTYHNKISRGCTFLWNVLYNSLLTYYPLVVVNGEKYFWSTHNLNQCWVKIIGIPHAIWQ